MIDIRQSIHPFLVQSITVDVSAKVSIVENQYGWHFIFNLHHFTSALNNALLNHQFGCCLIYVVVSLLRAHYLD